MIASNERDSSSSLHSTFLTTGTVLSLSLSLALISAEDYVTDGSRKKRTKEHRPRHTQTQYNFASFPTDLVSKALSFVPFAWAPVCVCTLRSQVSFVAERSVWDRVFGLPVRPHTDVLGLPLPHRVLWSPKRRKKRRRGGPLLQPSTRKSARRASCRCSAVGRSRVRVCRVRSAVRLSSHPAVPVL